MARQASETESTLLEVAFGYNRQASKWETTLTADGATAFRLLRRHLRETGGSLHGRFWPSFGKLKQLKHEPYHCHLNHHEVAVWQLAKERAKLRCTFIYLGPRKDAPYR